MFEANTIITPTTTLGHIGAIPLFVDSNDAVIMDHLVHNSVQTAVSISKSKGTHTELIRHNRLDILEDRIKELRNKYNHIWYMADGTYSMFGDSCPVEEVVTLMNRYPQLHVYLDDAHGMSWRGKHGRGNILSRIKLHENMIVALSMAKAFASGGGILVFPQREQARRFRTCAGTMLTSGPLQPAVLGACVASAKIHYSDEIYEIQSKLRERIELTARLLKENGIPSASNYATPIFFIGMGLPKLAYTLVQKMMDEGFYTNPGIFPGVPIKNTGLRFTITNMHTFEQIEDMVATLAFHFKATLEEENYPIEKIYKAFHLKADRFFVPKNENAIQEKTKGLTVQYFNTIDSVNKEEWDNLLSDRGTYDWNGLSFLEKTFSSNNEPENNWKFNYLKIKDKANKPVLATFITTALWKDDMMAHEGASARIEMERKANNPYYLTSKVVSTGSLLSEGNHLYLDRTSAHWKDAMFTLFEWLGKIEEASNADSIRIRDLPANDFEMDEFMVDNGFFKVNMPKNHSIKVSNWTNMEEYISLLSKRSQKHLKDDVLKHYDKFEMKIIDKGDMTGIEHWYNLYLNVKNRSYTLNTFTLPYKLFENMACNPNWDIISLSLKPEFDTRSERKPVVVCFSYLSEKAYNAMIIGIDYDFQDKYKSYRQAIYRVVMRAKELGKEQIKIGYSASKEKQKFGAITIDSVAYMQAKDNYSLEAVSSMSVQDIAEE
jgi:7-keto-8-aminopelargonate synthetase-like enzyme